MWSISEDLDDQYEPSSTQINVNNLDAVLKRKGAMKKSYSPWRSTAIEIGTITIQKECNPLRRAYSAEVLPSTLSPYNPSKPLIKDFPLKKYQISHLARARSIKTTIGPLTKEVCEHLNITVNLDDHLTEVFIISV